MAWDYCAGHIDCVMMVVHVLVRASAAFVPTILPHARVVSSLCVCVIVDLMAGQTRHCRCVDIAMVTPVGTLQHGEKARRVDQSPTSKKETARLLSLPSVVLDERVVE